MTATTFGEMVADIVNRNVVHDPAVKREVNDSAHELAALVADAPIIDATVIYETYSDRSVRWYEDHPCVAAPWDNSWVCYRNEHGNLMVTLVVAVEVKGVLPWRSLAGNDVSTAATELLLTTWGGGRRGDGKLSPTFGPKYLTRIAVDAEGQPLDINWVGIDGTTADEQSPWPRLTVLGAFNLLNCRNVELQPRAESRSDRRRRERAEQRSGVSMVESTIHVRSTRSQPGPAGSEGTSLTRLHSVRGNVHHYGDCCPGQHEARGLLFGRITGRIWVPQHARGSAELGATRQTFIIDE